MHKHPPTDFLPAAGRDSLLPFYDIFTRVLGVSRLHRKLLAQASLRPGQNVLEIGCGTGNLSILASRTGVRLTATDPDTKALARAAKKARGIRFEQAYAQDLPYADESFDTILSAIMLHHLDRNVKAAAFQEALRVLKPGGKFHIVDIAGHGVVAHGEGPHFDDLSELLAAEGFETTVVAETKHLFVGHVVYLEAVKPGR